MTPLGQNFKAQGHGILCHAKPYGAVRYTHMMTRQGTDLSCVTLQLCDLQQLGITCYP